MFELSRGHTDFITKVLLGDPSGKASKWEIRGLGPNGEDTGWMKFEDAIELDVAPNISKESLVMGLEGKRGIAVWTIGARVYFSNDHDDGIAEIRPRK